MDSPAESPICHTEFVKGADTTDLPRSLRRSNDKQDKMEWSFSKYTFYNMKTTSV